MKMPVDALLATACSRLLQAASTVDSMRRMHLAGENEKYWLLAKLLGEHLEVAGATLTQAHAELLGRMGIAIQHPPEGMIQ